MLACNNAKCMLIKSAETIKHEINIMGVAGVIFISIFVYVPDCVTVRGL